VVSNNSSGMCCGVSQNTYHTLRDMRVVFADGTVLDTADPISRQSFLRVGGPGGEPSAARSGGGMI
jgi:D-lactate dehydrogenase